MTAPSTSSCRKKHCPLGRAFGRALELSLLASTPRVLETEAAPVAVE